MEDPRGAIRRIVSYIGPGFLVTVGFIDPGNWATNIAAGSTFNYDLLWVVTLSTLVLILWQHVSAHLGIAAGKCLAEATREHLSPWSAAIFGSTAVAACIATALAEILGAALGLYILLSIPVKIGLILSTIFVILMNWFQQYRSLEKVIIAFVSLIGLAYLIELYIVKPNWGMAAVHAVVPELNSGSILIAMGVLGAVVMPHNMYLHSEIIQSREWSGKSERETRRLLRYEFMDTLVAMIIGMAINMAMVIVAAAVFHRHGVVVNDMTQASETLRPLAGQMAEVLFGVALLFSGLSSSMTAGVSGGITISGYLGHATDFGSKHFRWGIIITLVPALIISLLIADTFKALIISQVCLSVQLPLTMLPIFILTNRRSVMGKYTNGWFENGALVITGLVIVFLNALLVYRLFGGRF